MAHLGTNQAHEVERMIQQGDKHAELVLSAMSYQIAKWIGGAAVVLKGDIDGIILTGGIANSTFVVNYIRDMVSFIAPIIIYPGEDEMEALAENALNVLSGAVEVKVYK